MAGISAFLLAAFAVAAGCAGAAGGAGSVTGAAGPVAVSGLVLAPPAAGAPGRAAPLEPVAGATVTLGTLSGTTDARGIFTLSADLLAPGLRDLAVRGPGRFELHYAAVVRPREQLLLKLQYDAGTQRVYATECRIDCPEGGPTTVRAAVRRALAAAAGAGAEEVAAVAARELPADLTEPEARNEIAARILAVEADAERAEAVDLSDDPAALVAACPLRFRPFPSGLALSPAALTLAPGDSATLEAALLRSDGTRAAAPAAATFSIDAPAVARLDGRALLALAPGTAEVRLAWKGLVSNPVALTVTVPPAPSPDGRSPW